MTPDDLTTGVFPAMTTPFDDDGSIDHDQLAADVRRLESAGVDGLVPVGSTGESATLTHDEHIDVVETVVEARESVPVIAGSGSNSTHEAVSLSRRSAEAGADALLLISPYYNKPEPAGMEAHYRQIADEVDLPQIIYNVPSRTGRNIAVETAVNLASHENVVGYKAASGDLGRIGEVAERTADEEFSVISGDDGMTLPILATGGTGVISVAANVEPERVTRMTWAALEGRYEEARSLHHELGPLFRELFVQTNPIPVKEAMAIRGYGPAELRLPLTRLDEEYRAGLESVLEDLEEAATV
ncbi:Dihydrodipicolinate synthase/N-acetylneuraminatelyase [Halanaeroarchaeum sp. HSR-CO]|uniref:4-hydroxy-tetrahydrodipicolinate synthase n=1 Tax=Halanaeroarchaeum sp. HSR-CO TaxID=2866382 RepID=UPI00217E4B7C|nr:4-hydroxy-tetrahydrodipicolinate synthase [Halanaeroarchaeum sp. HSR-CO]UWG47355.1 Dihydrodipicolinate synthase/N-acetylneuraminatelyase [Halanaeroarchaeum sp. HSR-CO]